MGALENLFPEKLKRAALHSSCGEFILPYLETLAAIEIATLNEIAILGVDSHEVRNVSILTHDLSDGPGETKFTGDWTAYVQRLNVIACTWIVAHPLLGANQGYILTSSSKVEFDALKLLRDRL
jgi:hypothetical protein